jgi:phosphate transport system permease protein
VTARIFKDRLAGISFGLLSFAACALVFALAAGLLWKAMPILREHDLATILGSSDWHPTQGRFGLFAFIVGTLCVTLLAMVIAVPLSLLTAILLAEYAPRRFSAFAQPFLDLLSGIPSVVFGVWGVMVVVPAVGKVAGWFGSYSSGYSWLAGSLVLVVMVSPFMVHLTHEILRAVPLGLREASLSLGATRWQTVKSVLLRRAMPGVVAAVVLGFSRALGETIAVLMVVGNVPEIPRSVFDPAYPLPALIANNYGEMMSIPLYDSALMLAALVLLAVVLVFNVAAQLALGAARRGMSS